jgi:hypothetical protein
LFSLYDFASLFLTRAKQMGYGATDSGISIVTVSFSGQMKENKIIVRRSYLFFNSMVAVKQLRLFLP